MIEPEFRLRLDADWRAGRLSFVQFDDKVAIAMGLNGPETIVLFGGQEIPMADADFVDGRV